MILKLVQICVEFRFSHFFARVNLDTLAGMQGKAKKSVKHDICNC